jgi:SNF2 family DNA or RNA helicase
MVHQILVKGTLEERIDSLLEKKRAIAEDVIDVASGDRPWTRDELLKILQPWDIEPVAGGLET